MRGIITIAALILLLNSLTGTSQNNNTRLDTNYIPLFADTNVWYIAEVEEFGGLEVYEYFTNGIDIYNDTIYRRISFLGNSFREDTIERKVYTRGSALSNEELYYDFTMEEGDSIKASNYAGAHIWFIVDSVSLIETLAGYRRAWYFKDEYNHTYPIWIEGIGSLAGIDRNFTPPGLYWMLGELNCCYYTKELVYQSELAAQYGCSFEYMNTTEILKDKGIKIFPNPVTNVSVLEFQNPFNEQFHLLIYNALGELIHEKQTKSNEFLISRSGFKSGIYFYQLVNYKNETIYKNKFLIK